MPSASGKQVFISQLAEGQQVREVFFVARKTLAETKAGKPYLALSLMDRSGEIEARVWDNADELDSQAGESGFVLVQGVARPFRDQLQLVLGTLRAVSPETVDPADFMPTSPRSLDQMARELDAVLDGIGDDGLRGLLRRIFQGEVLARFQRAPAAKKLHHAYIGGLIEHTLSVVAMSDRAAAHYPLIDRDLLIAGALLHDLAKIEEYEFSRPAIGYTDRGRLVGHLVLGVELIRKAAEQGEGIGPERLDQLIHIVLSHHGQLAYGSPVLPMTPEAMLLHLLDDMDAKMNYLDGLRRRMTGDGWQWTEYQRHLERFLYHRAGGEEAAGWPEPACAGTMPPAFRPDKVQAPPGTMPPEASPAETPRKGADQPRQPSLF